MPWLELGAAVHRQPAAAIQEVPPTANSLVDVRQQEWAVPGVVALAGLPRFPQDKYRTVPETERSRNPLSRRRGSGEHRRDAPTVSSAQPDPARIGRSARTHHHTRDSRIAHATCVLCPARGATA